MALCNTPRVHALTATAMQGRMADPTVAGNPTEFQRVAKAAAALEDQVTAFSKYKDLVTALQEAKQLLRECDGKRMSACMLLWLFPCCMTDVCGHVMLETLSRVCQVWVWGCRRPGDGRASTRGDRVRIK